MSKRPSKKQSKPQTRAEPPPEAAVEPGKTGRPAEVVEARKRAFLAAFRQTGVIGHATKAVDIHRDQPRRWRKEDHEFNRQYKQALNEATDLLESYALKRATVGVERPIYQGGKKVGTVNEISDTLLIFMLKARRPKKYRDRFKAEVSGPNDGPIPVLMQSRDAVKTLMANPKAYKAALEAASPRLPARPNAPANSPTPPPAAGGSA